MRGELFKLGGRKKNKWQRRFFTLDKIGVNWYRVSSSGGAPELKGNLNCASVTSVESTPDPTHTGKFAFKILSHRKDEKEYRPRFCQPALLGPLFCWPWLRPVCGMLVALLWRRPAFSAVHGCLY